MTPFLSPTRQNELFRICTKPTVAVTSDSVELDSKVDLSNVVQTVRLIKPLKTEPVGSLISEKNHNQNILTVIWSPFLTGWFNSNQIFPWAL